MLYLGAWKPIKTVLPMESKDFIYILHYIVPILPKLDLGLFYGSKDWKMQARRKISNIGWARSY